MMEPEETKIRWRRTTPEGTPIYHGRLLDDPDLAEKVVAYKKKYSSRTRGIFLCFFWICFSLILWHDSSISWDLKSLGIYIGFYALFLIPYYFRGKYMVRHAPHYYGESIIRRPSRDEAMRALIRRSHEIGLGMGTTSMSLWFWIILAILLGALDLAVFIQEMTRVISQGTAPSYNELFKLSVSFFIVPLCLFGGWKHFSLNKWIREQERTGHRVQPAPGSIPDPIAIAILLCVIAGLVVLGYYQTHGH